MSDRLKIVAILWESHAHILRRIQNTMDLDLDVISPSVSSDDANMDEIIHRMRMADASIIYMHGTEFFDKLEKKLADSKKEMHIVCFGNDPTRWSLTTVNHDVAVKTFEYMMKGGDENFIRMFDYVAKSVLGKCGDILPPVNVPWQGIVSLYDDRVFDSTVEYINGCHLDSSHPFVGIIGSRPAYLMDNLKIERSLAKDFLEEGVNPIIIFTDFSKKTEFGALSHGESVSKYFCTNGKPLVGAMVKFSTGFIGSSKNGNDSATDPEALKLISELNVPIFQPVILARMSEEEWRNSIGLTTDITWQIAFPEFEGIIEPIVMGSDMGYDESGERSRTVIPERSRRVAERVINRMKLKSKPNSEKKVLIFLNNFPCYGVEANVGNAAGLDSLESISDLLKKLKDEGYNVNPPADGRDLISKILESKALSEFRWTTVQEMKRCGGVIHEMDASEYAEYFNTLTDKVKNDIISTWGEPPGQGMVSDGKILITGVSFGNAVVAVQPKRGCFGSKCDGQVCKILHDPACPPTHQFIATYHYYEKVWGADAVIHTGTHGSMEWTPGKGVGLTESCYPDVCMETSPHFYIYNSDNPSEGLVAKRRSYATLIDHMQHLMVGMELYGYFSELDNLLSEYMISKDDPTRSFELKNAIISKSFEAGFEKLGLSDDTSLDECVRLCHEELSKMRNSQINKGLHILGRMPQGEDRVDAVNSIIRYGDEHASLRDCISDLMGYNLSDLYSDQGRVEEISGKSYGMIIANIGDITRLFVREILEGKDVEYTLNTIGLNTASTEVSKLCDYAEIIRDISNRIDNSKEIESLINGLNGGYIGPGPSGYITRGRYDILPTGRNFYSMDPYSVPSKTAWKAGCRMAEKTIGKYIEDEERFPESIGYFWTMGELISTGGELMSQIMHLLGVKPIWGSDGRVSKFEIIPLEKLGRPRIDVTINISSILRDNMMNAIDYMDRVICVVADLDEPVESNYVRKHTLESVSEGITSDDAKARMFGAPPGTYTSGVNLAIFASAWKEDGDLADVFVHMKGHGYGGGRKGEPMYEQFAKVLSRTEVAYDYSASDETDILSCSCHFSNIGGMVAASRYLSGAEVKAYYGDTRDPRDLKVGTLAEEIRRVMRIRTLNPQWIEAMKEHGYKGANDISKRVTRLFGWQATTHEVDDRLFDNIVETFIKDEEMSGFFKKNNPYALEEMERRLLEVNARGLWDADEQMLKELQEAYLDIESVLEDKAGDGEYQGGSIDIFDSKNVPGWNENMGKVSEISKKICNSNMKE